MMDSRIDGSARRDFRGAFLLYFIFNLGVYFRRRSYVTQDPGFYDAAGGDFRLKVRTLTLAAHVTSMICRSLPAYKYQISSITVLDTAGLACPKARHRGRWHSYVLGQNGRGGECQARSFCNNNRCRHSRELNSKLKLDDLKNIKGSFQT
jgi:hypothetical protein